MHGRVSASWTRALAGFSHTVPFEDEHVGVLQFALLVREQLVGEDAGARADLVHLLSEGRRWNLRRVGPVQEMPVPLLGVAGAAPMDRPGRSAGPCRAVGRKLG